MLIRPIAYMSMSCGLQRKPMIKKLAIYERKILK